MQDHYGNEVSTSSNKALAAYNEGVDLFLAAQVGADKAFERAAQEDPSFAMAQIAHARSLQMIARPTEAKAALERARVLADGLSSREQAQISILGHVIEGRGGRAYQEILTHVSDYPRDVMAIQPCAGVFSLIGFSGKEGREAESLAFFSALKPAYGDDWWYLSVLGFSQIEVGQLELGEKTINAAYDANPENGNAAHYKAHYHYEVGEAEEGREFIHNWIKGYDKQAILHCHVSWHDALWALEAGDREEAWQIAEKDIRPGGAWGPPVNVLTDMAAFLLRAELLGEARRDDLWQEISDYAATYFSNPGISFADAHAAIAHAIAGNDEALAKLAETSAGTAGDIVNALAHVYEAFAQGDWNAVMEGLAPALATHERIGGSRAQRDFMEFTYVNALLKLGRLPEARQMLAMRRPRIRTGIV